MDIRGSNGWKTADLTALLAMVKDRSLVPVIDSLVPLEDGIDAHRALEERRFFGKIVITGDAPV